MGFRTKLNIEMAIGWLVLLVINALWDPLNGRELSFGTTQTLAAILAVIGVAGSMLMAYLWRGYE